MDFAPAPLTTNDLPAWRAAMAGRHPLVDSCFALLDRQGTSVEIAPPQDHQTFAGTSQAQANRIVVNADAQTSGKEFCERYTHEAKHISQGTIHPAVTAWGHLSDDLFASHNSDEYRLAEAYTLPSVANDLILRTVNETDAYLFNWACVQDNPGQSELDKRVQKRMTEHQMLDEQTAGFMRMLFATVTQLREISLQHKRKPAVRWMSLSPQDIAGTCTGLWGAMDLKTPYISENGLSAIAHERTRILNNPDCAFIMQAMQNILSAPPAGQRPRPF